MVCTSTYNKLLPIFYYICKPPELAEIIVANASKGSMYVFAFFGFPFESCGINIGIGIERP